MEKTIKINEIRIKRKLKNERITVAEEVRETENEYIIKITVKYGENKVETQVWRTPKTGTKGVYLRRLKI